MRTRVKELILVLCLLMIDQSSAFVCVEPGHEIQNICTIKGYSTNFEAPDEFQLDPKSYDQTKISITTLKFIDSNVTIIPNGLFYDLIYVQKLDVRGCGLLNVTKQTFRNAHSLWELILSDNKITKLDNFTFVNCGNLIKLDLSHNRISQIGNDAFHELDFLIELDLSNNCIAIWSTSIFPNNLHTLNLNFNKITNFSVSILSRIVELSLNNNEIRLLELNLNIKIIMADNNYLKSNNLIINNNISSLSLRNNSLSNISFIKPLINLTYLDVSYNPIDHHLTDKNVFSDLQNLKSLVLQSANLTFFNFGLLADLLNLKTLDVSWNELNYINFNSISRLENLEYLKLNNNNIRTQTFSEFDYLFPILMKIDISGNDWLCLHLIEVLTKFKHLRINNTIVDENLVKTNTNVRGIGCTNVTNDELIIDLNKTSTEFIEIENMFHNHLIFLFWVNALTLMIISVTFVLNLTTIKKLILSVSLIKKTKARKKSKKPLE